MTIDKQKLVELLVEKTSMSEQEIKTQLDQLIERILNASKRGKALEIKEFGVFYFDEEGELKFDPADELSTEISFKYAGMKPVELKPERDTSIPYVDEEIVDDIEEDEENDPFADPFETSDTDPDPDEPQENDEVFSEKEDDPPFDFDDEENETEESIINDPFSSETYKPLEEPAEKEEGDKTNIANTQSIPRRPIKKRDNTGIFILVVIVVIAVLIGGYFYYVSTQSQNSATPTQSSTSQMESGMDEGDDVEANEMGESDSQPGNEQNSTPNQEMTTGDQALAEQAPSNQGTEEENESDNGISLSQTDQDVYGLMGSVIEEANNGYSIVLHSFRTEESAKQAAGQLRTDGYRVIVNSRTVYENLVWRVSVGQFETLGEAQQATTRLPEPFNTQNFIQRIRIN